MADTKIRISAETAQAERALKALGTSVTGLKGNLVSLAGVVGGALSVSSFAGFIKSSIDLQDNLGKLQHAYGITAQEAAGLKFASEQNGTELDVVGKAVKELMVNMSKAPGTFEKLGINATTATGALAQVADIVQTLPPGQERVNFLAEVMGKKLGPEMAEFLSQGGASLREYIAKGQQIYKVTKENAAKAKEYKDQLAEMDARLSGVGVAITGRLLPGLVDAAKGMNEAADKGNLLLVVWRALSGMAKVPYDLLAPPENLKESLKSSNRLKEMQAELSDIESYLKRTGGRGDGLLGKWLHGSPEEQRQRAEILRQQIEVIKRHAAELDKIGSGGQEKPKTTSRSVADLLDQKNGLEVIRSLERDYQNELAKRKDALNAPLLSASEKQLAEDLRAVHKRAQDARVELEKQKASQGIGAAEYKARLAEVTAEEQKQVAAVQELQAAQDKLNGSWEYGAKIAMRKYIDEAQNTAKLTEGLFTNAFKGMEDAMVQFVRTGKLDFKSLADSIINDMIRIQMQKALAGIMGSLFGGGAGAANPNIASNGTYLGDPMFNANGNVFGFAKGGAFTNGIFSSPTPFRFAAGGGFNLGVMGEAGAEAVMPLTRGPDGKLGVRSQGGGISVTYAPVIQIDARTDQAQVEQLVSRAVRQGNAELVDRLRRQGAI